MAGNSQDITTKFNLDVSGFKKGIADANKSMKEANAEFKLATSSMGDWSKSSEGIQAKLKQLDDILGAQNTKLQAYRDQLSATEDAYRENEKRANELKSAMAQLVADGISPTSEEYKKYQRALKDVEKEQEKNEKSADELRTTLKNQEAAVNRTKKEQEDYEETLKDVQKAEKLSAKTGKSVEDSLKEIAEEADNAGNSMENLASKLSGGLKKGLATLATAAAGAVTGFLALGESSQEFIEDMGKLETAFQDSGHSVETAQKTYQDFVGILGETDQSVEAVNHLAKLTDSTEELAKWTDIAAGVYATFGDSLQLEGLTEAANHTAQLGEVQGPLADALEWVGESTDKFNEKLAKCNTEQERATLITDTLNKIYGEAGKKYQETNKDLIAAREATSNMNAAMSDMGKKSMPIVTSLKNGFTEILKAVTDMLGGLDGEAIASKIESGFQYFIDTILPAIKDGLKWIIDNKDTLIASIAGIGAAMLTMNVANMIFGVVKAFKAFKKAQEGATIAQWLLNVAMNANPIGIIVAAIAGLVTAFVILWNKSEGFRNFWIGLWENIKEVASVVWEAITKFFSTAWDNIKAVWTGVKAWFTGIWQGIKTVFQGVTTWFTTKFTEAKNGIMTAFSAVGQFFTGIWEGIKAVWSAVATWFSTYVIEPIKAFFQPLFDWYVALFTSIWETIKSVFEVIVVLAQGTVELIKAAWGIVADWFNENVVEPVKEFFTSLWNAIKKKASEAWTGIKNTWKAVSSWFNKNVVEPVSKFFSSLWDGIKTTAKGAWDGIVSVWKAVSGWFNTNIIKPVGDFFTGMWDKLKTGASGAWTGIKNVFSNVTSWFKDKFTDAWTAVKNVFSTGGKIFSGITEGITSTFTKVVNGIIGGINKVIAVPFNAINSALDKLRNIGIGDVKPFTGLPTISVPQIPLLYRGGTLKKGQVGLLEGSGAEAVVPLERNKYWIGAVAEELKNQLGGLNAGINGAGPTNISTNSKVNNFTQIINAPKQPSRIELYRQTRNLLELKGGV